MAKKQEHLIGWRAGYIDAVFGIFGTQSIGTSPTDYHKDKEGYAEGYQFAMQEYLNGADIEELEEKAWAYLELYPI